MIARLALAAVTLSLAGAGPASAADPYLPFPEEDPRERAAEAVRDLNERLLQGAVPLLTVDQLEGGLVLPRQPERGEKGVGGVLPAAAVSPEPAGDSDALLARAGVDEPTDPSTLGGWWLLALAGLLALAAAAFEVRGRRLHQTP